MDQREVGQGPYPQKNLAYDLTFFHTADHTAAVVNGGGPLVTQYEIPVFRHLIVKFDVCLLYTSGTSRAGVWKACLLSGVLFGAAHLTNILSSAPFGVLMQLSLIHI